MTSFVDEFDSLDPAGQAALTSQWLVQKPSELFAELRTRRPIILTPIGAIVTKADDIRSILDRGTEFSVRMYNNKMERITGPFMLGMDDTARYRRESSILRLAFPDPGLIGLSDHISNWASEIVTASKHCGKIDVVSALTHAIPVRFVKEYFGVRGPDTPTIQRWARTIFHDIFLNTANNGDVRTKADISAEEMRNYLDVFIDKQAKESELKDTTVLGRLLRMRSTSETALETEIIRHNLLGMIVGAIDTTSTAAAYAIDWLLDNEQARTQVINAASSGDDALLTRCVLEVMRFKPQGNAVLRFCETDTTLAVGKPWETTIKQGVIVFAATSSAMFDPESVAAPNEFKSDRPSSTYFHFGYGLHQCFGRYINPIQLREIIRHLLLLPGLRRAEGPEGKLKHDGPFPSSLFVEFDKPYQ